MKRKLSIAAIILVMIAAAGVYFFRTLKFVLPADAVKVLSYTTVASDKPDVWKIEVLLTNTSSKKLAVAYPYLQSRVKGQWTDVCGPFDPQENYQVMAGAHATATQGIEFSSCPTQSWRLRIAVCEEFQGSKRIMAASYTYVKQFTFDVFSRGTVYYGVPVHLFSDEFPPPKEEK